MTTLLKIDPYIEAVYPVEMAGTLADLCQQLGARRLTVAGQQVSCEEVDCPCPDAAYCDEEALHAEPFPPAFRIRSTGHVIFGCALWHRVAETGELLPPSWSLAELKAQVEFLGFLPPSVLATNPHRLDDESMPLDDTEEE